MRDEIRNLPCTHKSRHDAAADLIHIYAHTKCFFKVQVRLSLLLNYPNVKLDNKRNGPVCDDGFNTGQKGPHLDRVCVLDGRGTCLTSTSFPLT